ncbi:uncharacterized protein LOC116167069 [Photinus pyralis]|nr:uncharacterized protein LOC116167069 [Photinus pyralis]
MNKCTDFQLDQFARVSMEESLSIARRFTCKLYGQGNEQSLDVLRHKLTTTTKKSVNELPPTEDAFFHHVSRCFLQCRKWIKCQDLQMEDLDPFNFGWKLNEEKIEPILSTQDAIPPNVRNIIELFCTDSSCNSVKCVCTKEGLICISECKCKGTCKNVRTHPNAEDDEELHYGLHV